MFKTFAAAVIAFSAAAPVLADEAAPHQFGQTVASALSYLTIDHGAAPFTRDAQVGEGGYSKQPNVRSFANSQRTRVFAQDELTASRNLNGYRGFGTGSTRIDR